MRDNGQSGKGFLGLKKLTTFPMSNGNVVEQGKGEKVKGGISAVPGGTPQLILLDEEWTHQMGGTEIERLCTSQGSLLLLMSLLMMMLISVRLPHRRTPVVAQGGFMQVCRRGQIEQHNGGYNLSLLDQVC